MGFCFQEPGRVQRSRTKRNRIKKKNYLENTNKNGEYNGIKSIVFFIFNYLFAHYVMR